jgi:hypothetical protein
MIGGRAPRLRLRCGQGDAGRDHKARTGRCVDLERPR